MSSSWLPFKVDRRRDGHRESRSVVEGTQDGISNDTGRWTDDGSQDRPKTGSHAQCALHTGCGTVSEAVGWGGGDCEGDEEGLAVLPHTANRSEVGLTGRSRKFWPQCGFEFGKSRGSDSDSGSLAVLAVKCK